MHCDEGNQAVRAGLLLETGQYRYDPQEHHGPTLYWLTLPSLWVRGVHTLAQSSEADYRIVPVLFGAATIAVLALLADGIGWPAVLLASLLVALSPAMVFYSRYYVQESLLVFFTVGAMGCAWRCVRSRSLVWAAASGLCFGLMHATKETWILAAAAMVAAVVLNRFWNRWAEGPGCMPRPWPDVRPLSIGLAAAVLVAVALYSSLGTNLRGPLDSLLAYGTYFHRGNEGGIHAHPWYYYLELLVAFRPSRGFFWSEGLIVGLALVGAIVSLWPRLLNEPQRSCSRFLAIYTLVLTGLYSAIPYKTPWCLLSFLTGMTLLAGLGAWTILRLVPSGIGRLAVGALLAAGLIHLGYETYWLNFRLPTDPRNPYVYAHTSPDLLNLATRLERLARVSPQGHAVTIHVVTPENYWPLPWYLRRFDQRNTGYWQDPAAWKRQSPALPVPDVLIVTPDARAAVDSGLRAAYNRQSLYGLRPGVLLAVYVREELWQSLLGQTASP